MSSAGLAVSRIRVEDPVISPRFFKSALDVNYDDEPIMIFLSYMGNTTRLRVFKSGSIESVKMLIQNCQGYKVRNQKLVCGGRELSRSDSLLRDYGVDDGDVFHLVHKLSDLLAIKVRLGSGEELSFEVGRNRDVAFVKKEIAAKKGFVGCVDDDDEEEEAEILYEGERLEDQRLIDDICKRNDDAVIHLVVRRSVKVRPRFVQNDLELSFDASVLRPVVVNPMSEVPEAIMELIRLTRDGLAAGHSPILSAEGSGGVYLMQDVAGLEYVAVFKPIDEEPNAPNNPHGLPQTPDGEGLKRGTVVGQGAFMEAGAYLLDHPVSGRRSISGEAIGFSGVPPTGLVNCLHKGFNHPNGVTEKIGSLQKFMKNNGSCEDIGPGAFPVEEVHKICVLDMRLANADRHAGNILFRRDSGSGRITLIPIDHGYCLPERFEDCTFDWLVWPQAKKGFSPETIEYIRSLDAEEDIALLKFYGWDLPVERARTLRISTMLLKKGAERGLTPYAIGNIMCRTNVRKESVIEEIVQEAFDGVLPGTSEAGFMEAVSEIMEHRLDEITR